MVKIKSFLTSLNILFHSEIRQITWDAGSKWPILTGWKLIEQHKMYIHTAHDCRVTEVNSISLFFPLPHAVGSAETGHGRQEEAVFLPNTGRCIWSSCISASFPGDQFLQRRWEAVQVLRLCSALNTALNYKWTWSGSHELLEELTNSDPGWPLLITVILMLVSLQFSDLILSEWIGWPDLQYRHRQMTLLHALNEAVQTVKVT